MQRRRQLRQKMKIAPFHQPPTATNHAADLVTKRGPCWSAPLGADIAVRKDDLSNRLLRRMGLPSVESLQHESQSTAARIWRVKRRHQPASHKEVGQAAKKPELAARGGKGERRWGGQQRAPASATTADGYLQTTSVFQEEQMEACIGSDLASGAGAQTYELDAAIISRRGCAGGVQRQNESRSLSPPQGFRIASI